MSQPPQDWGQQQPQNWPPPQQQNWGPPPQPPNYQMPQPPPKRRHRFRNFIVLPIVAFVALIVAIAIATGSGGSKGANTGGPNVAAGSTGASASATAHTSANASKAKVVSDNGQPLPITNGDWRLNSVSVKNDGLGNFGGVGRVLYLGKDTSGASNIFTLTVFVHGKVVSTLIGSVDSASPGGISTVQFIGTDKFVKGPYTFDFEKNL